MILKFLWLCYREIPHCIRSSIERAVVSEETVDYVTNHVFADTRAVPELGTAKLGTGICLGFN